MKQLRSWLLPALAGLIIPWVIALAPSPVAKLVASTPDEAARPVTPTDQRAADLRRLDEVQSAQMAQLDQMIAERQQLVADLESIADLVPTEYRMLCLDAASANNLPPRLLAAVGWTESRWDPDASGSSGEIGIMQIMPETGAWIAQVLGMETYDLADVPTNVYFGAAYLRMLLNEGGTVEEALAQYNAGPAWRERAPTAARSYVDRVRQAAALQKGGGTDGDGVPLGRGDAAP